VISAFRGSANYEAIQYACKRKGRTLDAALDKLEQRGLLQVDRGTLDVAYTLHPLVRDYAYFRLHQPAEIHNRLGLYFGPRAGRVPPRRQLKEIEELMPRIELFHHAVRTGEFD
jgi:hypothetical protein